MEVEKKEQQTNYTALYRRWRPQLFSEVVGQNHVTRTLQNALAQERVAHAYLFCGLRGTGKTTMAKLLGKALNCLEGVNPEPCNRCRSCQEVMEGRNMDVIEIDAASNRGIDEIRDLREKARYVAAQNRYKVYIIDEVHMLTNEAFNALLKTLEEPPPKVVFILATTEAHRLPLTVISRCQRFDFHLLEAEQIVGRLRQVADDLCFSVEEETLYLLARQAEGSARDALGFLEQCKAYGGASISNEEALEIMGLASPEVIFELLQAVREENLGAGLAAIREIVYHGRDLHRFLQELILYLRKLLLLQAGAEQKKILADVPTLSSYLLQHEDKFSHHVLLEMLEILQQLIFQLKSSSQPHFLLELAFLRLSRAYRLRHYLSSGDFFGHLEALERKLQSLEQNSLGAQVHEPRAAAKLQPGKREQRPPERATSPPDAAFGAVPETVPAAPSRIVQEAAKQASPEASPQKASETAPIAAKKEVGEDPDPTELLQFWENTFLPELKKQRKAPIHALLQVVNPVSCKAGIFTVTLPFIQRVLKPRIEAPNNKKVIESFLQQLLGVELSLRVILEEEGQEEPAAELAKSIKKTEPLEKTGEEEKRGKDFFFQQMLELFNGRLIKTYGEPLGSRGFWSPTPTGKET